MHLTPIPFLGLCFLMKSEVQATEGCVLKPKLCCQWCFQCWQKEACSLLPRIRSRHQNAAAAPEKPWWENVWWKWEGTLSERRASPVHSVLVRLTFSCLQLLSVTSCPVQGSLHTEFFWLMVLPNSCVLYNYFYMQCYQEKLQTVGVFPSCTTCSLSGFAIESLWYWITSIHS